MLNLIFTIVFVILSVAAGEYLLITPFMDSACKSGGDGSKCVELDTCFPLGPSNHIFGKVTYVDDVASLVAYVDDACTTKFPVPFTIER